MRLDLNRESQYAIRALVLLAIEDGRPLSGRTIAARTDVPERLLARVLGRLGAAEIVESRIGRTGGYRLSRDPARLSILEVVETIEGITRSDRCVLRQRGCDPGAPCAIHPIWSSAQDGVIDTLGATTLAALVASERAINPASPRALVKERTVTCPAPSFG
ncbi:MAG TPA: Rrf2 family transcriptional regulator [Candidatus Limnocylindrales bacterium]|nr:Rrf2 family transcriptional regulator [Candidatus Limnocylindrales bacterium]